MREMVNLQEQLRKLAPQFDDCSSPCARLYEEGARDTDLESLCETCDVRYQLKFFEESARNELARRFPDGCPWTFETLSDDVLSVQKLNKQVRGRGYPRGCTELEARLLDILRSEEWRPVRIMRWEAEQKARNRE
jgi:hypothetical protein